MGVRTGRSTLHHAVVAKDGTRKFLMQLFDGYIVETVGIPVDDANKARLTVCVSSQVHGDAIVCVCGGEVTMLYMCAGFGELNPPDFIELVDYHAHPQQPACAIRGC